MNRLKTMRELVDERIAARNRLLLENPQAALDEVMTSLRAAQKRLNDDPTLAVFTAYWEAVLNRTIGLDMRQALALILAEWDSMKDRYDAQFETPAGSSG